MHNVKIVVPWHNEIQIQKFLEAWGVKFTDQRFVFQKDSLKEGCAKTKNAGIKAAMDQGAETVIILDDDCFPETEANLNPVGAFIEAHMEALRPTEVELFKQVTLPSSRGTPYFNRSITMPVAASMGFWNYVPDYDAVHQLALGATHPMQFDKAPIFGMFFPLCGMNLAFRPKEWLPWCNFVDVPRFDDIWQGFLWQKAAYAKNHCFNLNGPVVRHSRQSDVWANLRDEAANLKNNETAWQKVYYAQSEHYEEILNTLLQ
jgi:hypothetical protein